MLLCKEQKRNNTQKVLSLLWLLIKESHYQNCKVIFVFEAFISDVRPLICGLYTILLWGLYKILMWGLYTILM
jgi:hypothetical protein